MNDRPQGYDIDKILAGDEREWERVFECFRYCFMRNAYRLGYRGQDLEELVGDACVHVFNRRERIDHARKAEFPGFVRTVGYNYMIDQSRKDQRRKHREARVAQDAPKETENPALKALEVDEIVEAFLARLTPRLREVFRLRVAEKTNPEIAEMLNVKVSAVSTAYSRALARLKDFIKEFG